MWTSRPWFKLLEKIRVNISTYGHEFQHEEPWWVWVCEGHSTQECQRGPRSGWEHKNKFTFPLSKETMWLFRPAGSVCTPRRKADFWLSYFACRFNLNSSEDVWHGNVRQTRVCSHVNYIQLCATLCVLEKLGCRQQLLMFCNVIMFGKTTAVLFCSPLPLTHSHWFFKEEKFSKPGSKTPWQLWCWQLAVTSAVMHHCNCTGF